MRHHVLRSTALMLALLGTVAAAQDAPRDTGAGGPLPGPNATPAQAVGLPSDGSNMIQPVPGAMPGSDTVPSTLSEKNAADDKLLIIAYTFKNLTDEQRRTIYQALTDKPAGTAFNADVSAVLPFGIELHSMPDDVIAQVPQTKGYQYAIAENRVLLVSPANRIVVAAIPDASDVTTGRNRRPEDAKP